ncbi:MAG: hypothetical protein ABF665_11070, partial [Gluconacetobacter sp.]
GPRDAHQGQWRRPPPVRGGPGGGRANGALRARLDTLAQTRGLPFAAPPLRLCTDNAVMVGWAAIETLRARHALGLPPLDERDRLPRPRWPLDQMAARLDATAA